MIYEMTVTSITHQGNPEVSEGYNKILFQDDNAMESIEFVVRKKIFNLGNRYRVEVCEIKSY